MSDINGEPFYLDLSYGPPVVIITVLTVYMQIFYALYFRTFCGQRYRQLRNHRHVRHHFWTAVVFVLIVQTLCAALTFELAFNAGDEIAKSLRQHWEDGSYGCMSVEQRAYWDQLQTVQRCCGLQRGPADWHDPRPPQSCAGYRRGCVTALIEHTRRMGRAFGWLGVAMAGEASVAMAANWWLRRRRTAEDVVEA